MAATTADQIQNRIRSICAGPVFGFVESVTWTDFDLQPDSNIDGVFRVPPLSSQTSIGGFGFWEDRTETVQIWVARKPHGDYDAARTLLQRDVHSLTAAVMRDADTTSGDYHVLDEGRGHAFTEEAGAEYLTMRLTLPLNYDAQF